MKLRQGFLLIVLVLLGGTLCRGQTSFVTGGLTAVGTACSTTPPTNTQRIVISNTNFGGATFTLSGTFVGTLGFFGSGDAGNSWQPLGVTPSSGGAPVTTATAPGLWQANVSAYTHLCILTLAYTSGTATARIHVSSISARTGGAGGGGLSLPSGSVPGQSLGVGTSGVVAVSPGLLDSTASPIGGAYTPVCTTSTNTGDRGRVMVATTAANVTIPGSGATGCANSIFYFLAQAAIQFTATTGDTFDVYDGNTAMTGLTTYSISAGEYVTANNGSGTNWHLLVESPAGGGALPLSNVTSAIAPSTLTNGANTQTWNWVDTNNGPNFVIGESAPSTNGTLSGPVNSQTGLQVSTLAASTSTPLSVNQGSVTGAVAIPAAQIIANWNNAGLTGQGLVLQANCTACAAGSPMLNIFNGTSSTFRVGYDGTTTVGGTMFTANISGGSITGTQLVSGSLLRTTTNTANLVAQGGTDGALGGALGAGIFRGADNNAGSNGAAIAGSTLLRGGMLSATIIAATAIEGAVEIGSGYFGQAAVSQAGDVVCMTTTQQAVADCPATATTANIVGIANTNTIPMFVATYGTVPVRLTAAGVIGDTVCLSTVTAGKGTDSGGTAACPNAGQQIGVIVATAGSVVIGSGVSTATATLSTTYPLVQLHIR